MKNYGFRVLILVRKMVFINLFDSNHKKVHTCEKNKITTHACNLNVSKHPSLLALRGCHHG